MLLQSLLVILLFGFPPSKSSDQVERSRSVSALSAAGSVDRALVHIETGSGTGSGFQYLTPGYILTNRHVVGDVATGGKVKLRPVKENQSGAVGLGEPFEGTVRFKHPRLDVAVIDAPRSSASVVLKPVAVPGNNLVARGTPLIAHGFPAIGANATPTVSQGVLSAHYTDPISEQVLYLTDVALSPGSSGGPVTDSAGAVIGIATSVSIVIEGAGNSWGYVLPIGVIEESLHCGRGVEGLPQPFDLSKHLKAIAAASSADAVMQAYERAIGDVVKQTGSATELGDAASLLSGAVAVTKVGLPLDRCMTLNDCSNRAAATLNSQLLEYWLLDQSTESILARLYRDPSIDAWRANVFARLFSDLPAEDRATAFGELLSTHANGVIGLVAAASHSCETALKAVAARDGQTPHRSEVRSVAQAMSAMLVCYSNLMKVDPQSINVNDEQYPPGVRQRLREAQALLETGIDHWQQLDPACRQPAEEMIAKLTGIESSQADETTEGADPEMGKAPTDKTISGSNGSHSVGGSREIGSLTIAGSNNTIKITAKTILERILVAGSNNTISVEPGVSIRHLECAGSNNTINVNETSVIKQITFTGSNNDVSGVDPVSVDVSGSGSNNDVTP